VGNEKLDFVDLRSDANASLESQYRNAQIWTSLAGPGHTAVAGTIGEAIKLVRDKYEGAQVLITGSHYLAGGSLYLLRSEH